MDNLTLAALNALVSDALDVYQSSVAMGMTPAEAHKRSVIWSACKAESLDMVHGAKLAGAQAVIANIPNLLQSLVREQWPAELDTAHCYAFAANLKRTLCESLVINLF